jgi:SAM-dependent methyltransferase
MSNSYYDLQLDADDIAAGKHRELVGGHWDLIGKIQFDYLKSAGLRPEMKIVDVGCGCFRGGVQFIAYLDAGNYYGLDANEPLLKAGYDVELVNAGLQGKMPHENMRLDRHFDLSPFGVQFDMAIAQSLFTHLPLNDIRRCLIELAKCMKPGGRFYATIFECPPGNALEKMIEDEQGWSTRCDEDWYHYRATDMAFCAAEAPWDFEFIGDWGHPRGQKLCLFTRREP